MSKVRALWIVWRAGYCTSHLVRKEEAGVIRYRETGSWSAFCVLCEMEAKAAAKARLSTAIWILGGVPDAD